MLKSKSLKRKTLAIILVGIAFFGCATTKRDWQDAEQARSISSYEQFLQNHPVAEEAALAKSRVAELKAEEDWRKAEGVNTIPGYEEFLKNHPQYKLVQKVNAALNKLLEQEYEKAKLTGTIDAYIGFIQAHPNAETWVNKAKKEIGAAQAWESVQSSGSKSEFKEYLASYPSSKF